MFKLRSVLSDFWVKSGEWFVFVSEYYEIEIEQEGLVTRSRLETTLSVQYMHKDHFDILPENRKGMPNSSELHLELLGKE